jgi:type I phosphodiesterase/nucleotide pyrophosphatase
MKRLFLQLAVLFLTCAALLAAAQQNTASRTVRNVLVVTMDGMRWQEVFGGMTPELLTQKEGGVSEAAKKKSDERFGGPTPEDRRAKLLPFIWTVVAKNGQVFGDPSKGSDARVTNGLRFSYPGYNEILSGFPDPRIDSNDRKLNPNVTVLEWLNGRPDFNGKVAAFASWELLPWIVNTERSHIPANGGGAPITDPTTDRERTINEFAADLPPYWGETRADAPTGFGALEYLKKNKPRVLYVMLGETDEWAHGRRYDLYLDSAWRNDRFIRRLWETAQSMPEYADTTALVLATDHGRGNTAENWTSHGEKVLESDQIWMAVMGPGVAPLGAREGLRVTQSQAAATIAMLLGEDYNAAQPKAAPPLKLN